MMTDYPCFAFAAAAANTIARICITNDYKKCKKTYQIVIACINNAV